MLIETTITRIIIKIMIIKETMEKIKEKEITIEEME